MFENRVSQVGIGSSTVKERVALAAWYMLALLTAANAVAFIDRFALSILMEPIKADLALNDKQLGLVSGLAFAIFYSTLGIPLARLADRSSRMKILAASLAIWSLMTALTGLSRNLVQMFLARVGVGIGEAGCVPVAHSLIGDVFPRELRALAVTICQCGAVVGTSLGLFVVGSIGQKLGWREALMFVGLLGVPLAVLVLLTLKEPPRGAHHAEASGETAKSALMSLIRRPALLHLIIGFSLCSTCAHGINQWLPSFLIRSFHMKMAAVGAWTGLAAAVGGIGGLLTGGLAATWLTPRDPRWELWIPALTYGASIPLFVLMAISPDPVMVLIFKTAGAYLGAAGGGVALAAVQSFAEPNRRATAVAITLFLSSIVGAGIGPVLTGAISDLLQPTLGNESLRYALLISCILLVWGVVHLWVGSRRALADRIN